MVRTEARNYFLSKFFETLDIVLSRLDLIILDSPSSLGRNFDGKHGKGSHGACIACDRPLRTRVSKSYKRHLTDRAATGSRVPSTNSADERVRPFSAGPIKQTNEIIMNAPSDRNAHGFVKRSGFKTRLSESMSQEKLVEELIASFPKDVTFPGSCDNHIT